MIRRFSTLKQASQRTRQNVEDRYRYYDIDNVVGSSRPWSPLIDRQCLSPLTERQLQNACLFLSRKIEFPDRWKEFDTYADLEDFSTSSSHFPDLKISSFTIPDHIASCANGDPSRGSDVLPNVNENGIADAEDKDKFGLPIELNGKQELTHGYCLDAFGSGRSGVQLDAEEPSKSSRPMDESKCQSHFSSEQISLHETLIKPSAGYWKDSRFNSREKSPGGVSTENDVVTDIWTIEERVPSGIKQEDTGFPITIPMQSINEEPRSLTSSKNLNMPAKQPQVSHNPHLEGSESFSSPVLENSMLGTSLKCQTETNPKQRLRVDTNLSPISDNHTLTDTQSWSSRSAGGRIIIDANGLEKVMTPDEERQRRLGLQRAVMERMSGGGCSAPTPTTTTKTTTTLNANNTVAATLHSNPQILPTSPGCDVAGTKGQSKKSCPDSNLGGQAKQHPWDQQSKKTLVRKLSRITLGKKKSIAKPSNVLGFSAVVEAR
ncbi:hypothetical protein AJ78_01772 [Emergomyces pasteurianus Ep9510]|uniref:Uncharacterized protein n=1 Tax=Emergomyces pasteurianus Ep9510 TaxID=1447872 RepID=A0A1J9PPV4_9EURO|nr:hypothetical protein AJ78_01772 [Emergomyces pasteurianus Ep9510]